MPPGKILKSGPLRVHIQHSGAKIRVFLGGVGGKARNNFRGAFRHDDRPNSF